MSDYQTPSLPKGHVFYVSKYENEWGDKRWRVAIVKRRKWLWNKEVYHTYAGSMDASEGYASARIHEAMQSMADKINKVDKFSGYYPPKKL